MQPRSRFPQNPRLLYRRLNEEAERLRKEAMGTQPGAQRDRLIRRARRAETALTQPSGYHRRVWRLRNDRENESLRCVPGGSCGMS